MSEKRSGALSFIAFVYHILTTQFLPSPGKTTQQLFEEVGQLFPELVLEAIETIQQRKTRTEKHILNGVKSPAIDGISTMGIHTYIHNITSHYITLHYITLHCITLHHIASHNITLHYITLHYITLHYIASHCNTLHYIALHYIALHCITLHHIALHCITYIYIYIWHT